MAASTTSVDRQALALRAWEAVSRERSLQGVLEAVADVLLPIVPFDTLSIVSFHDGTHDLYALHIPNQPYMEGETLQEYVGRIRKVPAADFVPRPVAPYPPNGEAKAKNGCPLIRNDLLACETWFEHEFHLAGAGIRSYVAMPLVAGDKLVGVAPFCRMQRMDFGKDDVMLLGDVCRALAVAVDNAVANEQLRKLRDQLQEENIALRTVLAQTPWFEEIAGSSAALRGVLESVEQVAGTDATVLITGETGTGKELIARAIHRRSPRAQQPLIKVNCAAIPESLLASELFGHERGAFTGALERRKGRFEQADHGTLFLDEVGEMPLDTQVMLLRVLQEREFERVGGSQTIRVDVRIVAATNRNLLERVRAGLFRSDLYYRLNVFPVHMPPLRERTEDIPPLVAHFAQKHGNRFGRGISHVDPGTLDRLASYHWPGNVRELENMVERAVIISRNGVLRLDRDGLTSVPPPGPVKLHEDLKTRERDSIDAALRETRGRVSGASGAAARLGIPASTLEFRIRRLGIDKFRYRLGA